MSLGGIQEREREECPDRLQYRSKQHFHGAELESVEEILELLPEPAFATDLLPYRLEKWVGQLLDLVHQEG